MKRNIYISYIHSDSMNFKFKIMDKFKGRKYKFSDELDLTSNKDEALLKLEKRISHMDVTVVLISRSILENEVIPYEVEYSLYNSISKSTKGIVGVVIPDKGNDYSYLMKKGPKGIWGVDKSKLPAIIATNMHNELVVQNKNNVNFDSFISVYRWEDFIKDFENCVTIAYDKSTEFLAEYNITK